jgi:CheY-like chemotaxis protein/anti-sigma regulatory factor (Ser/Thr protein kinase)
VAHDINQSLAVIAGYSDLAQGALRDSVVTLSTVEEALKTVSSATYDAGETIKRLLDFARGGVAGPRQPVSLAQLLSEVARLTAPRWRDSAQAEGRHIVLEVDAQPDAAITGWPQSLREALTNLVFNAVDALPNGGIIRLTARRNPDGVQVSVADNGTGMTPEVQARIFEPFFTTKGEHGTGLGLPSVFGIVESHGGSVAVESRPGAGTTFVLTFPLPVEARSARRAEEGLVGRSLDILHVEDEGVLRLVASLLITRLGHRVVQAASAEEALGLLEGQRFDVVLSDIGLGAGMNGWELAETIRRNWPGLPVVLATGWGASITPEEAAQRGVAGVLAKPYGIADLESMLARVVAADREPSGG